MTQEEKKREQARLRGIKFRKAQSDTNPDRRWGNYHATPAEHAVLNNTLIKGRE